MRDITPPESLAELLANPQRVRDAFILLGALANIRFDIVPPGGNVQWPIGISKIDSVQPIISLPIQLPNQIADPFNSSASCQQALIQLFAGMKQANLMPGK